MAYEWILLDFDGTMVDTGKGIVSALKMATEEQGILDAPLEKTWLFIGPPIHSFARGALKLDEETAVAPVKKFRKRRGKLERIHIRHHSVLHTKALNILGQDLRAGRMDLVAD